MNESEGFFVNGKIVFHGSNCTVEYPEIRKTAYTKDFSWGFYCTEKLKQAQRWALRKEGTPVVNKYRIILKEGVSVKIFEEMTDEWLDFIAACRSGEIHAYDIVEGPMADDEVWNYVNDYLAGNISRSQFWVLAAFKYPTHQISFHTLKALDCLVFEGSETVNDK